MANNLDHVHLFIQFLLNYSINFITKRIKRRSSRILQISLNLKKDVSKVSGHKVVIMEVFEVAGKLLKIILPDKIENLKAEVYKQALDLSPYSIVTAK
ncbi:MAG: transposase [Methanosarcinales archaeon]|nr:transposase [Methanosarcinales archaeon]